MVFDLETSNGLTEEKSPTSEVCVTTSDKFPKFCVFFWGVLAVLHIAKVIFTLDLVLVAGSEVVFWKLESDGKQDVEGV